MSRYSSPANSLSALGPLDGRYAEAVRPLAELFSEQGLIRQRLKVELPGCGRFAPKKHSGLPLR